MLKPNEMYSFDFFNINSMLGCYLRLITHLLW